MFRRVVWCVLCGLIAIFFWVKVPAPYGSDIFFRLNLPSPSMSAIPERKGVWLLVDIEIFDGPPNKQFSGRFCGRFDQLLQVLFADSLIFPDNPKSIGGYGLSAAMTFTKRKFTGPLGVSKVRFYDPSNLVRWRLAAIGNRDVRLDMGWINILNVGIGNAQIGAQLARGGLSGFVNRSFGGSGRFFGLFEHPFGGNSGASGFPKRSLNKVDANARNGYHRQACPKHEFCPIGHPLLGFQIAYFIVFGALALGGVLLSYQIADRGFDFIERGRKLFGGGLFVLAALSAPAFAGALRAFGFWLTFEGGQVYLLRLLG